MAATGITETSFNILGEGTVACLTKVLTTGDWVLFDSDYPGALSILGRQFPTDNDSEVMVWAYSKLIASAAVATTTAESMTYDNAVANQRTSGGYYILNDTSNEIMYVVADDGYDSTSGTLTVKRGALGTTAAAVSDNDQFSILNCIEITTATAVGPAYFEFRPLPTDYNVKLFA